VLDSMKQVRAGVLYIHYVEFRPQHGQGVLLLQGGRIT
jgi:hypothetical protein